MGAGAGVRTHGLPPRPTCAHLLETHGWEADGQRQTRLVASLLEA
jgi:hypothetical protein